ncbi:PAS domain-containing protein [Sagittula sp.]|uniref:PAS domain-containing protein n=1 Tax=Sagittula sp. TaxID=2038081 RepID=UPI003514BC3C
MREEIPDDLVQKGYVEFQSGVFRIVPSIRNRVVFAVHNVAEDPPYTQTDLIICRNLLIYLSPGVQARVITHFSFSLRKEGVLMLGAAESPGQHGSMFQPLIGKMRIFRNRRVAENRRGKEPADYALTTSVPTPRVRRLSYRDQTPEEDLQRLLTGMLESNGAMICVVDEKARMIKTFGDVSPLLHFPTGGFSAHLLDLIDDRLRSAVMLAIRRAEAEGVSERRDLRMTSSDDTRIVDLVACKISWQAHTVAYAVQFNLRTEELPKHPLAGVDSSGMPRDAYVAHLESEVRSLQDMLSATAEDLGASNEELQTTNEELTAANEELQANNEETQSINEELHTVNAEHAERIADLEAATSDIENLLATADVGIVVLSNTLRVRRYSAGLAPFMDLGPRDVDRPLDNVTTTLTPDSMTLLADDARIALETNEESGRELRRKDGGWVRVRTRPFYGPEDTPRGVVCSMQDVTSLKLLELEVADQRERIEIMLESEVEGVFDWQVAPGPCYLSPRFRAMLGYGETEVPDRLDAWLDLVHPDDLAAARATIETHLMSRTREAPLNIDMRCRRKDGSYAFVQVRSRVMDWSDRARPARVMGVIADISELRAREDSVKRQDEGIRRFVRVATLEWNALLDALGQVIGTLDETKDGAALERLKRLSGLMERRTQATLEFWNVEPGDLTIERQDLTALAHTAAAALETEIEGTELTFDIGTLPAAKGS